MGFSLSNLLQQGIAQVNPFDNGQTAATVRQQQRPAPAAQLPSKGQPGFGVLAPRPVQPAPSLATRFNNFANSNYNPTHLVGSMVVDPVANAAIKLSTGVGNNIYNHGIAPVFNLPHNTVQQDLVNTHNPYAQNAAGNIGNQTFKQQAGNALVLGASMLPGGGKFIENGAVKAGGAVTSKLAPAIGDTLSNLTGKVTTKLVNYGGKAAIGLDTGYGYGAGQTMANDPNASLHDINKAGVQNAKIGAALGIAAPIVGDAAPVIAKGANKTITPIVNHVKDNQAITAQQKDLAAQIAGHQQQLNSLPVTNHTAAETLQRKIDAKTTQIANLEASRPQLGVTKAISTAKAKLTPLNQGGYIGNPFFKGNEQIAADAAIPIHQSLPTTSDPALSSSLANAADNLATKAGQDTASYGTAKAGDIAQAKYGKATGVTTGATKREIAELDRKINAFGSDNTPAKQTLIDRRNRRQAELDGTSVSSTKANYQMDHRPTNGASVTDIANGHDNILASSKGKTGEAWTESRKAIEKLHNADPNTPVTVYRSAPSGSLNHGDWITLSPSYAKLMADAKVDGSKVNKFTIPAKDIKYSGVDITEFGYFPDKSAPTNSFDSQLAAGKAKLAELDNVMHQTDTLGRQIDAERKIYNGANEQQNFVKAAGHKLGSDEVLYHGTAKGNKFTSFDSSKAQTGNRGNHIYLTDNAEAAKYHSWASDQSVQLKSPTFDLSKGTESRVGEVLPVKLAKDAKIKQLDHAPTSQEIDQLKQQGYHGASFKEDLYNNAEDIPTHLVNPDKMKGSTTTVLFDGKKAQVQSKPSLMDKLHIKPINENGSIPIGKLLPEEKAPATKQLPGESQKSSVSSTGSLAQDAGYAGGVKKAKFSQTVKDSPEVSPEVSKQVNTKYQSDTMQGALDRAVTTIKQQGLTKSLNQTLHELDSKNGTASRDTLARAIELAKRHDAIGTPSAQAIAANLYDKAAEHASAHGQSIQILAAIARKSPAGLRNKAFRDLKAAGIDVMKPENAHIRREVQGHIDAISSMKDGPAKDMAIAVMQKSVAKHIPQSATDNALSVWKAGLLSGVKTQQGNALSNGTFGALKKVSDLPAVAVDKAISIGTGKRTVALTGKGIISGTKQGVKSGWGTMRTGIDPRNVGEQGGKYEQHAEINFKNKYIQNIFGKPSNLVFRGMSAADQPFYYAALKNSLYDQAKADGLTNGLRGAKLNQHMTELATNPTEAMVNTATKEAEKAVLGNDTVGSNIVNGIRKGIENSSHLSPVGKKAASAVMNVLAPFTKVPSAFIARTVDFTPLGIPKTVISQISHGKFDQRALSQSIGEATTGTGIIALGVALSQKNLISGDYPKNDQKEAQRWKAEGITPNSVKVGNQWVSMNYLGPVGLLFNAGHQINQAGKSGESAMTKAFAATGGLGQGLLGQSFLQGFSGATNAIQDPQRSLKTYVNSQVSSTVPAWMNDVANLTDPMQRQADTALQSVKNRIPGLRESNNAKQDVYGNNLKQPGGQLNTLNGIKPSSSLTNSNPAIAEVNRLHTVNPNDSNLQVTPTPIGKSITVGKQNVKLTDQQAYNIQKQVGQNTLSKWNQLIQTPEYKAMDDTQKAAALNNIKTLASEDAQRSYVVANNLGTYSKPESKKAAALANGTSDVSTLASSKATGGTGNSVDIAKNLDPSSKQTLTKYGSMNTTDRTAAFNKDKGAEYAYNLAEYNNKKASGKLSTAQDIASQNMLAREKVGSSYDKNIRDLYNLSAADLSNYLTTDKNGQATYNQLKQLDQAYVDSGIRKTSKFKNGLTTTTKTSSGKVVSTSKSTGGSRSGSTRSGGSTRSSSGKVSAAANAYNQYKGTANSLSYDKKLNSLVQSAKLGKTKGTTTSMTIKAPKVKATKFGTMNMHLKSSRSVSPKKLYA